jgi:phospholipid/cholesterol/gamma-HCH transport system substrate-binding protein
MVDNLDLMVEDVKVGKGLLGKLMRDESLAKNLEEAVVKINRVVAQADSLAGEFSGLVKDIRLDATNGKGPLHALLRDSLMAASLTNSLENIQQGTDGFNQNMEAVKHSFLLRGYYKKLKKQQQKNEKK